MIGIFNFIFIFKSCNMNVISPNVCNLVIKPGLASLAKSWHYGKNIWTHWLSRIRWTVLSALWRSFPVRLRFFSSWFPTEGNNPGMFRVALLCWSSLIFFVSAWFELVNLKTASRDKPAPAWHNSTPGADGWYCNT